MTLRASVASVEHPGVSEGGPTSHPLGAAGATTRVIIPLGYADGVPRQAGRTGPVAINGVRFTISDVLMDQFVVEVAELAVSAGDPAVLFGSGHGGEPTAQDWADAVGTIHYEIVARIGPRVPRTHVRSIV